MGDTGFKFDDDLFDDDFTSSSGGIQFDDDNLDFLEQSNLGPLPDSSDSGDITFDDADEFLEESLNNSNSSSEDDLGDLDFSNFDDLTDNEIHDDSESDSVVGTEQASNSESLDDEDIGDGALLDDDVDLHDDDEVMVSPRDTDFISETGTIVVQDASDDKETGFELTYVPIDKIAITHRIRNMKSVESLVQSIQSTGLLKPLVVAPTATEGMYVLLDGYRRIQACAKVGKTKVPCVVNTKVNTPEIPILEAMYNHSQNYSIDEQIAYIKYLKEQKGIMNPTMIEYLLQMNSGDYTKLIDVLNSDDDDIISKLKEGVYDIPTAFKKLEQKRKKMSAEEKEDQKAAQVYGDTQESGAEQIEGAGEGIDGEALTDEQINALAINPENLDEDVEDASLEEMVEADKNIEGFEPHKQKVGEREYIDPIVKKTVMARDNSTCQCCKRGGQQYVDVLDYHHIIPVSLSGTDSPDNGIMLCVTCHRLVHLYSTADLNIDSALLNSSYDELDDAAKQRYENEQIFEDEKMRFKRIIKLGGVIRKGIAQKGLNRDQYKSEHSNAGIGRRKPGVNAQQERT
jgi:uncharacterized ParB-like nuclease family protein